MQPALLILTGMLLLADAVARILLAWLILRIATGDIEAKDKFKRVAIFVGLDRLPEPPPDEYPKF